MFNQFQSICMCESAARRCRKAASVPSAVDPRAGAVREEPKNPENQARATFSARCLAGGAQTKHGPVQFEPFSNHRAYAVEFGGWFILDFMRKLLGAAQNSGLFAASGAGR